MKKNTITALYNYFVENDDTIDLSAVVEDIRTEYEKSAAKALTPLTGVESSEWLGDITGEKLGKIVESLGKAGIPQAYTDLLDQLLEESFG